VAGGLILILIGLFFLVQQFIPDVFGRIFGVWFSWPLMIIAIGGIFLLAAVFTRTGGLAIPGCIVGGIGLILYWQNATGNWGSWSYVWTLIPGFVGVGMVLSSLLGEGGRRERRSGLMMIGGSLAAFVIFWAFFTMNIAQYWPVILILVGLFILGRLLIRSR
jgi:hypothetical protein